MKKTFFTAIAIAITTAMAAQQITDPNALIVGDPNGIEAYEGEGKSLYNIEKAWLEIYPVEKEAENTGICLIIAPGGVFQYLAKEGVQGRALAKDLNKVGVTAIILNYPVLKSKSADPYQEVSKRLKKPLPLGYFLQVKKLVKNVREDAIWAIKYARENSQRLKINPQKIGIVGFSAGGSVAFSTIMGYDNKEQDMPNFVAGGSPYILPNIRNDKLPKKQIPMFISVSEGDEYKITNKCKRLIERWEKNNYKTKGVILPQGGHDIINYREKATGWMPEFIDFVLDQK